MAVKMAVAARVMARDSAATIDVGLPLTSPRQETEHEEDVRSQGADDRQSTKILERQADIQVAPLAQVEHLVQHVLVRLEDSAEHEDTGEEKDEVVEHVVMLDVADLVAEHCLHLIGGQFLQQPVAQED